ncbi:hypothetical protein JOF56_003038 [Kibdelosporangium banguiense]|uniref:Uncharacterized protein n=1 Tax=Kibdelosporangium banguiense TaxID=1365924 RepID=A0ABS4TE03_9PSEU|nr:hypothetical protein [Kibdelosporangium banguiense]MBP2322653.1 hypothetical protein [Kibdelosporangium banguiense]
MTKVIAPGTLTATTLCDKWLDIPPTYQEHLDFTNTVSAIATGVQLLPTLLRAILSDDFVINVKRRSTEEKAEK